MLEIDCPLADRVAAELADPAAPLSADVAAHLPTCPQCRAVADVIRSRRGHPSAGDTPTASLSRFQAELAPAGRSAELELGPYLLLERLGVGGMGEVYRARHRLLGRIDAVKTVKPEIAANPNAMRRFLREAEAAAKLKHPNVVHVYSADKAGAGFYIAMEFVPGSDLGKILRERGRLPVADACEYVRQAAEGLHHAFTQGIVHRDVKPANLLLKDEGGRIKGERDPEPGSRPGSSFIPHPSSVQVKVADFGLARAFSPDADASEFTAAGAILGTTDYMAPEQAEDARSADTRADVYSLGCTLFHLLTGQVPYPGGSLRDKLNRHATVEAPPLSSFRSDVPPEVERVVRKCMEKRPEQRFQTPGELAEALRAAASGAVSSSAEDELPETVHFEEPNPPTPFPKTEGGAREQGSVPPPSPQVLSSNARRNSTAGGAASEASGVGSAKSPAAHVTLRTWLAATAVLCVSLVALVLTCSKPQTGRDPQEDAAAAKPQPMADPQPTPVAVPPQPAPVVAGVLKPIGTFDSPRKDAPCVIAFGKKGELIAGRVGDQADGTDSGFLEVWPASGGNPVLSGRPKGLKPGALPRGVAVDGSFVLYDDLSRHGTTENFPALTPLDPDLDKQATGAVAKQLHAAAFSSDGRFVVGTLDPFPGAGKRYRLAVEWVTDTGKVRTAWQLPCESNLVAVTVDRTGHHVAAAARDGTVHVGDTDTLRRSWDTGGIGGKPTGVAITPDGRTVYAWHAGDKAIYAWDVKDDRRGARLECPRPPLPLVMSPDGRRLVAGGDGVRVWDLTASPPTHVDLWQASGGEFPAVAFDRESKRLAVGGKVKPKGAPPATGIWLWELMP